MGSTREGARGALGSRSHRGRSRRGGEGECQVPGTRKSLLTWPVRPGRPSSRVRPLRLPTARGRSLVLTGLSCGEAAGWGLGASSWADGGYPAWGSRGREQPQLQGGGGGDQVHLQCQRAGDQVTENFSERSSTAGKPRSYLALSGFHCLISPHSQNLN